MRQESIATAALLRTADSKGMFKEHRAGFGSTPSIRPVVEHTPVAITVRLSTRLRGLDDAALLETFDNVLRRLYDPDLPRFGPRAVAIMGSPEFVAGVRRTVLSGNRFKTATEADTAVLRRSVARVSKLLPDPAFRMAMDGMDVGWRSPSACIEDDYIASTDPLARLVRVDTRLSFPDMPKVLLDYVVFRELAVLCSMDLPYGRVDTGLYARIAGRFPDASVMSDLCRELHWAFTIPLEGE